MSGKLVALLGKGNSQGDWGEYAAVFESRGARCLPCAGWDQTPPGCDLCLMVGFDRKIPAEELGRCKHGFILAHSTDLPWGRGWAPIYHTMVSRRPLTQTLLFASPAIDAGRMLAKATYPLMGLETEDEVRRIDDRLTTLLLESTADDLLGGTARGIAQDEALAVWHSRRTPKDSRIDPEMSVLALFDMLRALPATAPAFFEHSGRTFALRLESLDPAPDFDPSLVQLEVFP